MQISGSQKPGGRSHARPLVGRKGGVNLPGSKYLHTRLWFFLDGRLVEEGSAATLSDDGREEEEEAR